MKSSHSFSSLRGMAKAPSSSRDRKLQPSRSEEAAPRGRSTVSSTEALSTMQKIHARRSASGPMLRRRGGEGEGEGGSEGEGEGER